MFNEQSNHNVELTNVARMLTPDVLAGLAFDIILLDLGLPDAQGLEAVRRARAAALHVAWSCSRVGTTSRWPCRRSRKAPGLSRQGSDRDACLPSHPLCIERKIMEDASTSRRNGPGHAQLIAMP